MRNDSSGRLNAPRARLSEGDHWELYRIDSVGQQPQRDDLRQRWFKCPEKYSSTLIKLIRPFLFWNSYSTQSVSFSHNRPFNMSVGGSGVPCNMNKG